VVDASKDGFINLVLPVVAVCCFVTTNVKCPAQGTALHVLKSAKTVAHTASANTNVESHVKNATNPASGGAGI
jgi:hypothetical protein